MLNAIEHLLLSSDDNLGLSAGRATEPGPALASAQHADEAADPDSPHPRRRVPPSVPLTGALPNGHEGVLHSLGNHISIGAATGQPRRQPCQVTVVELPERAPVPMTDRLDELRVRPHHQNCRASRPRQFSNRNRFGRQPQGGRRVR